MMMTVNIYTQLGQVDATGMQCSGDTQSDKNMKTFVGTGDPIACLLLLNKLVYKAHPSLCQPKPCAIGSFYQPTLPVDMEFYAVGAFIHTLSAIGALDNDGRYTPSAGFEKAFEYCRKVGGNFYMVSTVVYS